jgi:GTP-binding protein
MKFFVISAVSGEAIEPLKYAIAELVAEHRPAVIEVAEPDPAAYTSGRVRVKPAYPPPAPRARGRAH